MFAPGTRILIVDDMESSRQMLLEQLRRLGFQDLFTAKDGQTGLAVVEEQNRKKAPIELILSDWNMPRMTGLDFLKAIRSVSTTREIPFVMITAESDSPEIWTAIEKGVSNYLIKPFTIAMLQEKLEATSNRAVPDMPQRVREAPPENAESAIELFRQIIDDAMCTTMRTLARTQAVPGQTFIRDKGMRLDVDAASGVTFTSAFFHGTLVLAFPEKCYRAILSRILNHDADGTFAERDGVAEILNIVLGQLKMALNARRFEIKQPAAIQISGAQAQSISSHEGKSQITRYETECGPFFLEFMANSF